jgi:hypothetical protein
VRDTKQSWGKSRPDVQNVWPVKIGTNLSRKEILDLEHVGFQLPPRPNVSPRRLFGMEELPSNLSSYPNPASLDDHPKTKSCKNIRKKQERAHNKICQQLRILSNLEGSSLLGHDDSHTGCRCIIILASGVPPKIQQYMITIGSFPECSCEYFKDMAAKSLGKHGQWVNCMHLYFVFIVLGSLDSDRDTFIHVPSFSFNEVKQVLESGILANRIPWVDQI